MTPAEFIAEYVDPSIALWRRQTDSPLLAVCALSQIDILAEVVATFQAGRVLRRGEASTFRDALRGRHPVLGRIQDAHDSHKHGRLLRPSADAFSAGQRPYQSAASAFFSGGPDFPGSFAGEPAGQTATSLLLNDGTPLLVGEMLAEAKAAWQQELVTLGLPPWE